MSGYSVAVEAEGRRHIFMVREPDPVKACELVRRTQGQGKYPVYALTPIPDATFDWMRLEAGVVSTMDVHACDEVICCQGMHE